VWVVASCFLCKTSALPGRISAKHVAVSIQFSGVRSRVRWWREAFHLVVHLWVSYRKISWTTTFACCYAGLSATEEQTSRQRSSSEWQRLRDMWGICITDDKLAVPLNQVPTMLRC
jgi:hypothetical protein